MMKVLLSIALVLLVASALVSQTLVSPAATNNVSVNQTNVPSTSMKSIAPDLDKLQATASQAAQDIGKLRIEKWKANPNAKSAALADADSVKRNLTDALPGLIDAARATPEDMNAEFKLYRDLNALYDVFGTVTEATRVFGQRGEYDAMSQQFQVIGSVRRRLGESLEQLTASTQRELNQMRLQIKDHQEQLAEAKAAAADARKEVMMAQSATPAKPAAQKKTVTKKPAARSNSASPNAPVSNSAATSPKS
jgi:peptidoglycan hydrolase CwlO-like protein